MGINTQLAKDISNDNSAKAVQLLLESLSQKYNTTPNKLVEAFYNTSENIPLNAFTVDKISVLEIVVKYLKEQQGKKYSEIAKLLNRDDRTIWTTYNNSIRKYPKKLDISGSVHIPISIFSDRKKSVLESLVIFLKKQGYSFTEISVLLKKDYQTIYTSYKRGDRK